MNADGTAVQAGGDGQPINWYSTISSVLYRVDTEQVDSMETDIGVHTYYDTQTYGVGNIFAYQGEG